MSYVVVQRRVMVMRGPSFWLAWMTDQPDTVYLGRSCPEAVGRLVIDQQTELPGWFDLRTEGGLTPMVASDPLTPTELKQRLREIADSGILPPVQGSFFPAAS